MDKDRKGIAFFQSKEQQQHTDIPGIDVLIASGVSGHDRVLLPKHSIFLVKSPTACTVTLNGKRLPRDLWKQNEIGFLPAHHEASTSNHPKFDEVLITIDDSLFQKAARTDFDFDRFELRFDRLPSEAASQMARVIENVALLGCDPIIGETLATCLAGAIMEGMAGFKKPEHRLSTPRQRRVIDYIEANLGKPISLADLADVASLSQYHLSRKFTRLLGMSPLRYVWKRRVEVAQHMLLNSSASLADIAFACGFSSQSHFTTLFKATVGTTPARFRATARA